MIRINLIKHHYRQFIFLNEVYLVYPHIFKFIYGFLVLLILTSIRLVVDIELKMIELYYRLLNLLRVKFDLAFVSFVIDIFVKLFKKTFKLYILT